MIVEKYIFVSTSLIHCDEMIEVIEKLQSLGSPYISETVVIYICDKTWLGMFLGLHKCLEYANSILLIINQMSIIRNWHYNYTFKSLLF